MTRAVRAIIRQWAFQFLSGFQSPIRARCSSRNSFFQFLSGFQRARADVPQEYRRYISLSIPFRIPVTLKLRSAVRRLLILSIPFRIPDDSSMEWFRAQLHRLFQFLSGFQTAKLLDIDTCSTTFNSFPDSSGSKPACGSGREGIFQFLSGFQRIIR